MKVRNIAFLILVFGIVLIFRDIYVYMKKTSTNFNTSVPGILTHSLMETIKTLNEIDNIQNKDGIISFSYKNDTFWVLIANEGVDGNAQSPSVYNAVFFVEKPVERFLSINSSFDPASSSKTITTDYALLIDIIKPLQFQEPAVTFYMVDNNHLENVLISQEDAKRISDSKMGIMAITKVISQENKEDNSRAGKYSSQSFDPAIHYRNILDVLLDSRWSK